MLGRPSLYGGSSSASTGKLEEVLMVVVLLEEWREQVGLVVGLPGLWLRWLALLRVELTVCRKSTSCRVAASYV